MIDDYDEFRREHMECAKAMRELRRERDTARIERDHWQRCAVEFREERNAVISEAETLREQLADAVQADKSAFAVQLRNQARMIEKKDRELSMLRVVVAEARLLSFGVEGAAWQPLRRALSRLDTVCKPETSEGNLSPGECQTCHGTRVFRQRPCPECDGELDASKEDDRG